MFDDEPLRTIYDILTLTCACGVLVSLLAPGADTRRRSLGGQFRDTVIETFQ